MAVSAIPMRIRNVYGVLVFLEPIEAKSEMARKAVITSSKETKRHHRDRP